MAVNVFVCRLLTKLAPLLANGKVWQSSMYHVLLKGISNNVGEAIHCAISFSTQKSEIKRMDINLMLLLRVLDKVN